MTDSSRHERFRAVTPGLRRILLLVLIGFGLMSLDSIYLLGVRFFAEVAATPADTLLSIWAFLIHVILGLLLVVPVVVYGFGHLLRARRSPNRNARRVGYVLFATSLILLLSGVLLLRVEGLFMPFSDGDSRALIWWAHVLAPLVVVWLFIAHRMVGPRLQWRIGIRWAGPTNSDSPLKTRPDHAMRDEQPDHHQRRKHVRPPDQGAGVSIRKRHEEPLDAKQQNTGQQQDERSREEDVADSTRISIRRSACAQEMPEAVHHHRDHQKQSEDHMDQKRPDRKQSVGWRRGDLREETDTEQIDRIERHEPESDQHQQENPTQPRGHGAKAFVS